MGGKSKGGGKKGKANAQTRGKAPGGRVYEVAQAILNAPPGGVASVIRAALEDRDAPIRRDHARAFTMFSTRCRKKGSGQSASRSSTPCASRAWRRTPSFTTRR